MFGVLLGLLCACSLVYHVRFLQGYLYMCVCIVCTYTCKYVLTKHDKIHLSKKNISDMYVRDGWPCMLLRTKVSSDVQVKKAHLHQPEAKHEKQDSQRFTHDVSFEHSTGSFVDSAICSGNLNGQKFEIT